MRTNLQRSILSFCLLASSAFIIAGCTSLVYSPFSHLPSKPLASHQGEVMAGGNLLPETRQEWEPAVSAGGELAVRYAFSDKVTLQARGWSRISDLDHTVINGFSFDGLAMLNDSSSTIRLGVQPRAVFMLNGMSIDGTGGILSVAAWLPKLWIFRPFATAGPAIGYFQQKIDPGTLGDGNGDGYISSWGYGFITNLGASVDLSNALSLTLEVSNPIHVNKYDDSKAIYLLPSVALAWTF